MRNHKKPYETIRNHGVFPYVPLNYGGIACVNPLKPQEDQLMDTNQGGDGFQLRSVGNFSLDMESPIQILNNPMEILWKIHVVTL